MKLNENDIRGIKVVHAIPGRVRLKVARVKHNPALAAEIQERFPVIQGILHVEANPVTSSVLLIYDSKEIVSPDSLGSFLEAFASIFPEVNLEHIKDWLASPTFGSSAIESSTISAFIQAFKEKLAEITKRIRQEDRIQEDRIEEDRIQEDRIQEDRIEEDRKEKDCSQNPELRIQTVKNGNQNPKSRRKNKDSFSPDS